MTHKNIKHSPQLLRLPSQLPPRKTQTPSGSPLQRSQTPHIKLKIHCFYRWTAWKIMERCHSCFCCVRESCWTIARPACCTTSDQTVSNCDSAASSFCLQWACTTLFTCNSNELQDSTLINQFDHYAPEGLSNHYYSLLVCMSLRLILFFFGCR